MNKLDDIKKIQINFYTHPPMEFLYALYGLGTEDVFYSMCEELNVPAEKKVKELLAEMRKKLSRYSQQELTYFFELSGLGYILCKFIIHNPHLKTVPEIIECVENASENQLLFYAVQSVCKNSVANFSSAQLDELRNSTEKMLDIVRQTNIQERERKEKLIESLENPLETKQRYSLLIRQFYEKAYKPFEHNILSIISPFKEKYEKMLNTSPTEFAKKYLKMNFEDITSDLNIHISFFQQVGEHHYAANISGVADWIVLGIHSDELFSNKAVKDRMQKFFKVLSDRKRIELLELLSERAWYGYEAAEELELTPATISYHMNFLSELDIVTFERHENRFYYSLNKNKIRELFEEAMNVIIKDA